MARVFSIQNQRTRYPIRISIPASKRRRGRERASVGQKGIGEVWMLAEGQREKTVTEILSFTLLIVLPSEVADVCVKD